MLFYDIEAFPKYWCVVVVDEETEMRHVFEDIESLREFYKANRQQIWIGYNSRNYDAPMLRFIMLGMDPYECSQELIVHGRKWFEFGWDVTDKYKRIPLKNFDCALPFKGLKKLEGFMGSSIVESSIPWDYPDHLTREQKDEVILYCTHDVLECRKVFYETKEEFDSHMSLIETFQLPETFLSKSKAQISAAILEAKQQPHYDEWEFSFPPTLKIEKYTEVLDWYRDIENHDYSKKLTIDIAGVPHIFAWGGLHGAIRNYSGEGIYLNMDVASYYPSMMIEYGYLSRNVPDPDKFRQIRDDRLVFKKAKDPRQQPYKIVINSTFGAQKDKYNPLYDPMQANNICVGGQVLLLDLIEKLEPYCQLIQSNTDGVLVKLNREEDYDRVITVSQEWSKRTRMELEYDKVVKIFQKDVNNYLIVQEDGKVKSKGAMVKKLSNIDNDLPIVNEAIKNELLGKKSIEDTINECRDLMKFQLICMISSKFKYGLHGDKVLNERYLRVFASTNPTHAGVTKVSTRTGKPAKISNTPEHCFLVNEKVTDIKLDDTLGCITQYPIDRQFYIDMAKKRIKEFVSKQKVVN
jgi:hypothetical protein